MPYKKKYRAKRLNRRYRTRKRPYYKKKYNNKYRSLVSTSGTNRTFPRSFFTRGVVWDSLTLSSTNLGSQRFYLNSIYDPFVTGGARLMRLLTLLNTIYQRYKVHAILVKVFALNLSTTDPAYIGILPTGNITATPTNLLSCIEAPSAKWASLQPIGNSRNSRVLKAFWKAKWFVSGLYKDEDFTSSVGSNPGNLLNWFIFTEHLDGATAVNIVADVEIKFFVLFTLLTLLTN